ncbi:hypothetical protein P280DRAFT_483345 [Massarina eburnea CBS 473.64]|uniref:Uncharacterized protein n=1 Tax=Massarina eburnea CBS 473.64 TaxID=1395130 RepID=A0A6A6RSY0_9PLEO|nr:hypothetical protein P280DRAFT_483345 [Massarina eburnea CBS 473.64]
MDEDRPLPKFSTLELRKRAGNRYDYALTRPTLVMAWRLSGMPKKEFMAAKPLYGTKADLWDRAMSWYYSHNKGSFPNPLPAKGQGEGEFGGGGFGGAGGAGGGGSRGGGGGFGNPYRGSTRSYPASGGSSTGYGQQQFNRNDNPIEMTLSHPDGTTKAK